MPRIRELISPNHDARPDGTAVDMLVLHCIGSRDARAALARPHDPAPENTPPGSVHYLVEEDGTVWRLVDEARRAWHADAAGRWRGNGRIDDRSIGVALAHEGAGRGAEFPVLQLAAACDLCLSVLSRHPIPPCNVVGHGDVAPDRRQDPGEGFDWRGMAENGVGIWPHDAPDLGTGDDVRDADALRDVRAALAHIGYQVAPEGALDAGLAAVLRAFQRHWRPEAVTGQADSGTLMRLLAVTRMCGG